MYNKSSLHVLAATTGLGDQRIEELWEGADLYARAHAGNGDQARYQKILHERMAELVEREVAKRHVEPEIPWVIADAHLGLIYVSADDALKAFGSRGKQVLH